MNEAEKLCWKHKNVRSKLLDSEAPFEEFEVLKRRSLLLEIRVEARRLMVVVLKSGYSLIVLFLVRRWVSLIVLSISRTAGCDVGSTGLDRWHEIMSQGWVLLAALALQRIGREVGEAWRGSRQPTQRRFAAVIWQSSANRVGFPRPAFRDFVFYWKEFRFERARSFEWHEEKFVVINLLSSSQNTMYIAVLSNLHSHVRTVEWSNGAPDDSASG